MRPYGKPCAHIDGMRCYSDTHGDRTTEGDGEKEVVVREFGVYLKE